MMKISFPDFVCVLGQQKSKSTKGKKSFLLPSPLLLLQVEASFSLLWLKGQLMMSRREGWKMEERMKEERQQQRTQTGRKGGDEHEKTGRKQSYIIGKRRWRGKRQGRKEKGSQSYFFSRRSSKRMMADDGSEREKDMRDEGTRWKRIEMEGNNCWSKKKEESGSIN